jgi:hypothetical protein
VKPPVHPPSQCGVVVKGKEKKMISTTKDSSIQRKRFQRDLNRFLSIKSSQQ